MQQTAIRVYRHGVSGGVTSRGNSEPPKRGECSGWSIASSRSNTRFLWSVRQDELTGLGVSFSLTVRDCPSSHEDWAKARRALVKRMERRGLIRLHWLTEMQRRGVPHLHGMAFFEGARAPAPFADCAADYFRKMIESDWLAICSKWGARPSGQHTRAVFDVVGWSEYLAKHAARGAGHYQRCQETLPPSWQKLTGRMWGHTGDWPTDEPLGLELDWPGWFRFRRLLRAYRLSKARRLPAGKRSYAVRGARRCLVCNNPAAARFRGVSGWIPADVSLSLVSYLASVGCEVESA